jgi:CO/xanthine dehydrogenase Mo-binding subunit
MAYGGGTAIEVRRRQDPAFASAFVDLSLIPGLDRLSGGDTGLRVGPMVTIRRMETDPLVARVAPLAAAAYGQVANPRVRNAASVGGSLAYGPYRLDPPAAPYRGFGVPQVTWAHESLVDELARARGEDPAAFRRRNLLRERDLAAMGTPVHSADFAGCLDAVTAAVGGPARPSGRSRSPS